ncbi:protein kinase family protein [Rhynchospora pubera]|uniref:Protein kinase family protein n=1 Tax=Rhynchospora pubera TaxID=906938 RepID=A0AAV8D0C8_9POAL|nr:protein kinase family protein [Rhynchospora pubera]
MATSVTHCSHPTHELVWTNSPSGRYICDLCKTRGSGLHYRCHACDFDLHEHCAEFPEKISFFAHPWHDLHLKPDAGNLSCDLCMEPVKGFYYRCVPCNFDVHPHCTKIKQIVRTELHLEHSLCLLPSINNKCSACELFNGQFWLYRCGMCKVKLHIKCVGNIMPMEHSHDNITSSTNNNRSNHGRGVTGARVQEERDNAVKGVVLEEIKIIQGQLELLQKENKKLQDERDNAVKEAKGLLGSASRQSHVAFSEFLLLELQQATENFSNSHKIGEGGFGSVFKGFLHNTMVAIKILHPESLQGKQEFEQEVTILSRMRHQTLLN